jgi:hypothetical protein
MICFTDGERSAYTILFAKLEERGQLGDVVVDERIILEDRSKKCV